MLKLTKKADYGLIAVCHLSRIADQASRRAAVPGAPPVTASAKDIADLYKVPLPLLSKVLQTLVRHGVLTSEQGAAGGYRLARDAREISTLEVIRSIDGPIILTHCFTEHAQDEQCDQSQNCPVRQPLRKVHEGIMNLLSNITVADLSSDDMVLPSISGMVSSIQPLAGAPLGNAPRVRT